MATGYAEYAARHADAGRGPERGSRGGPMDTASDVEDRAAANESHAGEQPLQDARLRVRATCESDLRNRDIPGRSDGDERERAKPGAAIFVLPVPRDRQRQRVRDGESQGQIEQSAARQHLSASRVESTHFCGTLSCFGGHGSRPTVTARTVSGHAP